MSTAQRMTMTMVAAALCGVLVVAVSGTITHPTGLDRDEKPVQVQKPGQGGVFGYMPPELNREEDLSVKLPRHMHCDGNMASAGLFHTQCCSFAGCQAVTFVMHRKLSILMDGVKKHGKNTCEAGI